MCMIFPFPCNLKNLSNSSSVNFGLYFNKLLPLIEKNGVLEIDKEKGRADWLKKYPKEKNQSLNEDLKRYLLQRHCEQYKYIKKTEEIGYQSFAFTATLVSPMILGIGESHPSEVGILLDRNLGIPYIPASSIKGVCRFAHTINLLNDDNGNWLPEEKIVEKLGANGIKLDNESNLIGIKEECYSTDIPQLFGLGGDNNNAKVGDVIFLDAYPWSVPEIKIDIMNPHYSEYYSGEKFPTDDMMPLPIKFFVVKEGAKFIFRCLVRSRDNQDQDKLCKLANKALNSALCEHGVGAKTAIGYGLFSSIEPKDPFEEICKKMEEEEKKKRIASLSPEEKLIESLSSINKDTPIVLALDSIGKIKNEIKKNNFTNKKLFELLKQKYQELKKWDTNTTPAKHRDEHIKRNEWIEKMIIGT